MSGVIWSCPGRRFSVCLFFLGLSLFSFHFAGFLISFLVLGEARARLKSCVRAVRCGFVIARRPVRGDGVPPPPPGVGASALCFESMVALGSKVDGRHGAVRQAHRVVGADGT